MPRYLTPAAYRLADEAIAGVGLIANSGVLDVSLAQYITRAEAAVDAYVGFSLLDVGGFAPHIMGLVSSPFDFHTRKLRLPGTPTPVRRFTRLRVHISNTGGTTTSDGITTDQGLYANLLPGEGVIDNWDQYGEIIALTLTYSLSAVIWELGLNPPILEVDCEVGYWLPAYGQTLYDAGAGTTWNSLTPFWASVYTQAASNQPNQLPPVPPVVYVNGVPQWSASLSAALTAGVAVTSLPVNALAAGLASGTALVVNGGAGSTAVTVTTSATVTAGATALPIQSWTPTVAYGAGTVLAQGYSVNYTEGSVTFTTSQSGAAVTADYTGTIPDLVREATIAQVSYLLGQRRLNQLGIAGLEVVRSGDREVRRARSDDAEEDQLCAKARLKLSKFVPIPVA